MTTHAEYIAEAYERGKQAAENAATWVTDGNESDESRRRKLDMIEAGDPEVWDYLPNEPNLSGEWADDPTPYTLAREITGEDPSGSNIDLIDDLADAFERGVDDHFEQACEAELRKWVDA